MKQTHLLIGEIVRPQGVRGEVKARHYTDDPERFYDLSTVYQKTEAGFQPLTLTSVRVNGDDVFLLIDGVNDRDQAEKLRGAMLYVDRAHARELAENQVFIADILGARAVDTEGREIGVLKDVLTNRGTDVFVFQTKRGELMAPAIEALFVKIDADNGLIVLDQAKLDEVGLYEDSHSDAVPRDV